MAVNTERVQRVITNVNATEKEFLSGDIAFVGSMYDEKHNFLTDLKVSAIILEVILTLLSKHRAMFMDIFFWKIC